MTALPRPVWPLAQHRPSAACPGQPTTLRPFRGLMAQPISASLAAALQALAEDVRACPRCWLRMAEVWPRLGRLQAPSGRLHNSGRSGRRGADPALRAQLRAESGANRGAEKPDVKDFSRTAAKLQARPEVGEIQGRSPREGRIEAA